MKDWDLMTDQVTGYKHLVHCHSDDRYNVRATSVHWCTARRVGPNTWNTWECNYCHKYAPVAMQDVANLAGCVSNNTWYSNEYIVAQRKKK